MDMEQADNTARDVAARVINPNSFCRLVEFPGMDLLGLNPDSKQDTRIAAAIIYALTAIDTNHNETADFGRLSAMLQYGIVTKEAIENALRHWYSATHEPVPMHDAF